MVTRAQKMILLGGQMPINYLIRDFFTSNLAAGSVNGTPAEKGTRLLTDTGNQVSINSGELILAGGGSTTDPVLRYSETNGGIAGKPGLFVHASVRVSTNVNAVTVMGFDNNNAGAIQYPSIQFSTLGDILARKDTTTVDTTYNYSIYIDYEILVVFLKTVWVIVIKGGAFSDWTVISNIATAIPGAGTLVYPGLSGYNRPCNYKYFEVGYLPAPWTQDNVVSGTTVTTGGLAILNRMHKNDAVWTSGDLLARFVSTGTTVSITRSGSDYWLKQSLGGTLQWRINLYSDGTISSLRESQIYDGITKLADLHGAGSLASVYEYAIQTDQNAALTGNRHGHDIQDDLTITVDGTPTVLGDGESATGVSIVVTRTSHLTSDLDANVGAVTTTYTITPSLGLAVAVSIVMSTGTITSGEQMLPMSYAIDIGNHALWPIYRQLSNAGGDVTYEQFDTNGMLAYDADGLIAVAMTLGATGTGCFFQDRGTVSINKIYCPLASVGANVSFSQRYMAAYGSTTNLRRR